MSSPVVETVRTIPLIIEKDIPMEHEEITGYPFERDSDRDGYLRSQLDDIAKRHPEIAEHLENFGQRDRQRTNPSNEGQSSPRRFPRQFSDRFEKFGFPFDREDFDPEYYTQQFYQPNQQPSTQQHSSYQHQPSENPSTQSAYSHPPPSETCSPGPQTSRCNSDLGQEQAPVDDRTQRSMSAPPSENTQNIPEFSENMSQSQSHSETKSSNERIIPIHIEGRDEPVLPKNAPSFSQQQHGGPQPERIFGKPSEHFTQFLPHGRDSRFANNWHQGFAPEEPIRQHRFQQQQSAPQKKPQEYVPPQPSKDEIPIPVQREAPPKQQEQPKEPQRTESSQLPQEQPKPAPPSKPSTPIEQIQAIQKDVSSLMAQVEAFTGKTKDKQYLYLDEMLTRNLIKLDNIDTQGQDNVRSARKEAIKCIEKTISVLEAKASGSSENMGQQSTMEVDEKKAEESTTTEQPVDQKEVVPMETEGQSNEPSIEGQYKPMEVSEDVPSGTEVKPSAEVEQTVQNKEETQEPATEPKSEDVQQTSEGTEGVESVREKKDETASEVVESDISVPEVQQIADNLNKEDVANDTNDQGSDNVQSATEVAAKAESETEDKKGKKDKKKGKKKVEKKEK